MNVIYFYEIKYCGFFIDVMNRNKLIIDNKNVNYVNMDNFVKVLFFDFF